MTFDEAMANHNIVAIRKPRWVNPNDRLILPPVIDGHRGPWCVLHGHDGVDPDSELSLLAILCRDDDADWQEWQPTAWTRNELRSGT